MLCDCWLNVRLLFNVAFSVGNNMQGPPGPGGKNGFPVSLHIPIHHLLALIWHFNISFSFILFYFILFLLVFVVLSFQYSAFRLWLVGNDNWWVDLIHLVYSCFELQVPIERVKGHFYWCWKFKFKFGARFQLSILVESLFSQIDF